MKITREFQLKLKARLNEPKNLIQVVVGPRQVGKTTGIKLILEEWSGFKIFESADGLESFNSDWLISHWQRAVQLGHGTLLVIDEIQKVSNWSEVVKKLYDQYLDYDLKIVLLGSASLKIQKGLQDSLVGRYELIKVPHWNAYEMQLGYQQTFESYLKFGGYPRAADFSEDPYRWQEYLRNSIIENVLTKDLIELTEIRNPALLKQIFFLCMALPAQEISFQKLVGQLQDRGAIATVKHYLEILESAYLIKLLYKFSSQELSTRTSSPKIIPLCPALINAVNDPNKVAIDSSWRGRIIESAIGSILSHLYPNIYYWRHGKLEVDYVIQDTNYLIAIEVKSGAMKGLKGLSAFCQKFNQAIPLILDFDKCKKLLMQDSYEELKRNPKLLLEL
jgi:predicted AAA+ superfamily ATPase